MSDAMMFDIARMPYEMAMSDEMSRRQFYANTQRLAAALEAAREDADKLREMLRTVSAVGVVQLFDTARDDVLAEFSLAELQEIIRVTEHKRPAQVEHIYREGWEAAIDQARLVERQGACGHLRDFATGKLRHVYRGGCPDQVNGPDARDPACPACQAIEAARFGSDAGTIRELLAERDQLAAALEAAREDAERWRALRELDGGEIYALLGDCDGIHPEQADAAIDLAMKEQA